MYSVTENERNILRALAEKYMQYSLDPINKEKIALWKALNRGQMIRPMVLIDQLPWSELNVGGILNAQVASDPWKTVETNLRRKLYQWEHFPVDMVLNPYIDIPLAIHNSGYGLYPEVERRSTEEANDVKSQHFTLLIKDMDDVQKIKDMQVTHDAKLSERWLQEAHYIFDGVAPVFQSSDMSFHLGVWDYITMLMGVEQIYMDLIDRPELLHALMERTTQSALNGIKQANELKVHADNLNLCHCSHIFTDELLPDCGLGRGSVSKNSWAFGLAQLFTSVSPAITEEFELPYISRMAEQFGMIYYGCCDRLDDRLHLVKRIPNVRKVSCSPWSKRDKFAENIGTELVMSNKPSPAFVAGDALDTDVIKNDLALSIDLAKSNNVNLEFILKDISTVRHQPQRLTQWADIAMKLVNNF